MADVVTKKKSSTQLFTHWARPRFRTYEYNNEYRESYYRPMVQYISTSRALAASSSSYSSSASVQLESSTSRRERLERRRRTASPPGALSFIERLNFNNDFLFLNILTEKLIYIKKFVRVQKVVL